MYFVIVLRRAVAVLVLLVIAITVLALRPMFVLAGLQLAGRSHCPWRATLRIPSESRRLEQAQRSVARSVRMLSADGDLQHWEIPGAGRFWFVKSFGRLNALVFAEQAAGIYSQGAVRPRLGDIVLDCGADYGAFTRRALDAGARTVLAIEIAPEKEVCLKRTFAQEITDGRVVVIPRGVWDRDDMLPLDGDSVVLARGAARRMAAVTTIDKIVAEARLARVDFIKMDIEGAEKRALKGAAGTLRRFRPRMAITAEHFPDDYRELPRAIRNIVPDYRVECGWCVEVRGRILPYVLYFDPTP